MAGTGKTTRTALGVLVLVVAASVAEAQAPDADAVAEISRLHGEMMQKRNEGALYPAIEIAGRRLELLRGIYPPDALQVTAAMQELASLHQSVGGFDRAIEIYERVVEIIEASSTADEAAVARALDMLASAYWIQQRFAEAEPHFERSLAIRRQLHGPRSTEYAQALSRFGGFLWARHAYTAAEQTILRSFCIMLAEHGRGSMHLVGSLISLSRLYAMRGETGRARVFLRELRRAADGEEAWAGQRVSLLSTAAAMYREFGIEAEMRATEEELERHYRGDIEAAELAHGERAPELTRPLSGLAGLFQRAERWDEAEEIYRRLIAITEEVHGADSTAAAGWRQALGASLQSAGRPEVAIEVLEPAARVFRAQHRPTMSLGIDLMLAQAHLQAGQPELARDLLGRVIRAASQSLGPEHPNVALALEQRGVASMAAGDRDRALSDLERAFAIHEPHIELVLAAGTEADNQTYFRQTAHHADLALTLNARLAPDSERAARFAYTTVLRRKGRILDAAQDALARVRDELGERVEELLDELSAARSRLAALIVAGPEATGPRDYRRELRELETEVRRLEQAVRARSSSFRDASAPIELGSVQEAIPEDAALVEIVHYHPMRAGARPGDSRARRGRYAAYVVGNEGSPALVDLGSAPAIDRAVTRFRRALADPRRTDVEARGRELHDRVFAPLEPALGTRRKVLLAPDAALNLVPFAALVDANDRFLVRRFSFTYLTSGRDLLRVGEGESARGRPVIVADPLFDREAQPARGDGPRVRGALAPEFQLTSWERLPGTAAEAEAIAAELDGARVLRGARATETAIKAVRRPSILHIATHGFFLPAQRAAAEVDSDPLAIDLGGDALRSPSAASGPPVSAGAETPLLRSGLVFAGVNHLSSGEDDGVLTALEAAGLDLHGTRLVVLSACETGVGEITAGDGVHGLRRAFVLAGAESLVMSLWQVDDEATRQLMTGYYRYLQEGLGRTDALRRVQADTLRRDRYRHPYYWASFVPAGDWTPIEEIARR